MNHGTFSAEPETMWSTEKGPDRNMTLLKNVSVTDPKNRVWRAFRWGFFVDAKQAQKFNGLPTVAIARHRVRF